VTFERGNFVPHYRVRYELPSGPPLVSIVVPTKDQLPLLERCVDGLLHRTDYGPLELIVVDNGSTQAETRAYLGKIAADPRVRVLPYEKKFNFSAINNLAVAAAKGSLICLLNNDIEVIHSDWLREMASQALRPEVGAVGAKLYYPNDTIQHAGVVAGYGGAAGHVFSRLPRDVAVQAGRNVVVQNFSVVTAGCLVMRRSIFEEVGGFDEKEFAVRYNDVDLCLKIVERGYRIVWTPYAELYHWESASIGQSRRPEQHNRDQTETERLRERWGARLMNDPFFNPNLSLSHVDYVLAFPPRASKPWLEKKSPNGGPQTK
jgi:GT2 family glycosyltransferase